MKNWLIYVPIYFPRSFPYLTHHGLKNLSWSIFPYPYIPIWRFPLPGYPQARVEHPIGRTEAIRSVRRKGLNAAEGALQAAKMMASWPPGCQTSDGAQFSRRRLKGELENVGEIGLVIFQDLSQLGTLNTCKEWMRWDQVAWDFDRSKRDEGYSTQSESEDTFKKRVTLHIGEMVL